MPHARSFNQPSGLSLLRVLTGEQLEALLGSGSLVVPGLGALRQVIENARLPRSSSSPKGSRPEMVELGGLSIPSLIWAMICAEIRTWDAGGI